MKYINDKEALRREKILRREIEARAINGPMPLLLDQHTYLPITDGKGVGGELDFNRRDEINGKERMEAAFAGLRDGMFDLVYYAPYNNYGEEFLTVALTQKGMEYFDSIPRLELECA